MTPLVGAAVPRGEPGGLLDSPEEALAFGWVDSRSRRLDERRWQLYCAPRKRGSSWSRANRARIERLAAAGLITAGGQAAVDEAEGERRVARGFFRDGEPLGS